jgi:hypothetical protein
VAEVVVGVGVVRDGVVVVRPEAFLLGTKAGSRSMLASLTWRCRGEEWTHREAKHEERHCFGAMVAHARDSRLDCRR